MTSEKQTTKRSITLVWLFVIALALFGYFFAGSRLVEVAKQIAGLPLIWLCLVYLVLGCLRGFTLIPVTYLIVLGLVFLPVWPAYLLTIAGVMVSSTCIYFFSEYLSLADYFKKNHSKTIEKLRVVIQKNELPIVISWSFFPFTPTDVMCYVCGSLRIDLRKFLFGVFVGEGISCAIYIFAGKDLLLFIAHTIF